MADPTRAMQPPVSIKQTVITNLFTLFSLQW
jgi:hypothetical protein